MRDQSRAKSPVVGSNLAHRNHGEVIIGIEDVGEANKVIAFADLNSTTFNRVDRIAGVLVSTKTGSFALSLMFLVQWPILDQIVG